MAKVDVVSVDVVSDQSESKWNIEGNRRFNVDKRCAKKFCIVVSVVLALVAVVIVSVGVAYEAAFVPTDVGQVVFAFHEGDHGEIWAHRIPVLLRIPPDASNNETLLIFAEGRQRTFSDAGPKRLSFKRSVDSGKTWTSDQDPLFRDQDRSFGYDGLSLGAAVYENTTKQVFVFFGIGAHEQEYADHYVISSPDRGLTWTAPKSLNDAIFDGTDDKVRMFMGGPASGIQLASGRLLVCGWYNFIDSQRNGDDFNRGNMVLVSDDNGQTWYPGGRLEKQPDNGVQPDECQVLEMDNGDVLINMRDANGKNNECGCRAQSVSKDGGLSWEPVARVPDLLNPVCQGSTINGGDGALYYTGPRSKTKRENGVMMRSVDDGASWEEFLTLEPREFGYSEVVRMTNGDFGLIFESSASCDSKRFFASFNSFWQCVAQGWGRATVFINNEIRFQVFPVGKR